MYCSSERFAFEISCDLLVPTLSILIGERLQVEAAFPQTQGSQLSQQIKASDLAQIYLKVGRFVVGRKETDIVFTDKAVSRKHADLTVQAAEVEGEQPSLSITDLGATFGTYVSSTKLLKGVPLPLKDGDVVRFGAQTAAVRVSWKPLVFCVTRMAKKDKTQIRATARELGALVVSDWGPVSESSI